MAIALVEFGEHTPLSRTEILLAGKTSVLWPENAHELRLCEELAPQPGGTNDNDAHVCLLLASVKSVCSFKNTRRNRIKSRAEQLGRN